MDDSHGFRIPGKPGVFKASSDMVTSLIKDACNFNEIGGGVNAVRAKNSTVPYGVDAGHGPMRLTATSSQGAPAIF